MFATQTLTRKEREFQTRRQEILDVAEQVFADGGFSAATMEEIARKSEFAVGTLYRFFKNKEDLYAEMLREKVAQIEPLVLGQIRGVQHPIEKLRGYFQSRIDIFWNHPRFFRVYYRHALGGIGGFPSGMTPEILSRYENHLREIEGIFAECVEQELVRKMNPRTLMTIAEGIIRSYTGNLSEAQSPKRNPEEEAALFDVFLTGIALR